MGELRMQGHRHLGPSYHENVRIRQQHGSGRGERRVRSLFFVRYFWFASSYCFGLVLRASYADNRRTFNIETALGVNTRLPVTLERILLPCIGACVGNMKYIEMGRWAEGSARTDTFNADVSPKVFF